MKKEALQALQGVGNSDIEKVLTGSDYESVRSFLDIGTKQSVEVGDAVLNMDTIYQLEDGHILVITWEYANEWNNKPVYKVVDTLDEAVEYYKNNYTARAIEWGKASLDELRRAGGLTDEELAERQPLEEWEDLVYTCWTC